MSQDNQQSVQEEQPNRSQEALLSDEDPGEVAAMMMNQFAPRYKKALWELSTGQSRRLNLALATYPLEYDQVMNNDPQLQQAYLLGTKLIEARSVLFNDFARNMEERQKEVRETLSSQEKEEQEVKLFSDQVEQQTQEENKNG